MDIKMPEMDGYEATGKIRTFNKDVIIIAQTAFTLETEQEKIFSAGFNDYIAKPIKRDDLIEKIEKYFGV
jgi:CheY-like chemotaxis protein